METSKALPPIITRIAKYTLIDEVQQRSFVVMFVLCALCVFLVRGCYQGNYMVNGQALDADARKLGWTNSGLTGVPNGDQNQAI